MTRATLYRELASPLERVEEGLLAGMVVPWDTVTDVTELVEGELRQYREAFERGAFGGQEGSGNRGTIAKIELVDTHAGGLGKVGYGLELETRDAGQWAAFRVLPRHREDVAQMVDDGYDGLSVGFVPKRNGSHTRDGVVWRSAAHLVHVALTPVPNYTEGRVLALREDAELEAAEAAARARDVAELDRILERRDRWAHLT